MMKEKVDREINEVLKSELELIVSELKQKHIDLGQKSTGKWVESLEVVTHNGHGVILANNYTKYLTKGRSNGRRPPIDPLEEWVKTKLGIHGKDARSVAFAVAFKIGKEGTKIFKDGGTDLVDGVITKDRIKQIKERVKQRIVFVVNEELTRELVL